MDLQEVEITIDGAGQVQVQVRGVKGTQCLDITQALEAALGGEVLLREMTPEALENDQQDQNPLTLSGKA